MNKHIDMDKFGDCDLSRLMEATQEITSTMEQQKSWQCLICDNDIYRKVFALKMYVFNEIKRRAEIEM